MSVVWIGAGKGISLFFTTATKSGLNSVCLVFSVQRVVCMGMKLTAHRLEVANLVLQTVTYLLHGAESFLKS
jgi:hypothetical protein